MNPFELQNNSEKKISTPNKESHKKQNAQQSSINKQGIDSPFTQFCRQELSPLIPSSNKNQSSEELEKKKTEIEEDKRVISQKKESRKYETPSPNKNFNQRKTIENLSPYIQSTAQQVVRELEFSNINVKPTNDATYIVLQSPTFKFIFDSKEGYDSFFQIEEDQLIIETDKNKLIQPQQQQQIQPSITKSLFAQEYQQKLLTAKKNEIFQKQRMSENYETPKIFKNQFEMPYPSTTAKKTQFSVPQQQDLNTSTKKKITCNCKKTKCLKLYCECFAAGQTCKDCHCCNCANVPENEEERKAAIIYLIDKNPEVFKPKVDKCSYSNNCSEQKHRKGCNCKKSNCRKKYCECFQAGVKCTDQCNCVECKNTNQICCDDTNKLDDEDSFMQYEQQSNNKYQLQKDSIFQSPQSFKVSNNKKLKLSSSLEMKQQDDYNLGLQYYQDIEQFQISQFKDQIKSEQL